MTPRDEVIAEQRAFIKRQMVMSVHLGTLRGIIRHLDADECAALNALIIDYGRLTEIENDAFQRRMLEVSEPVGSA